METAKKRSIEPLRERVYAYLKDRINTHRVRAGEFLDLDGIGTELGMSRTPLRDALFQLESEGFITIFPRRGVMVNTLELKTIRDIYEIIGALESAALISVAVRIDDRDVAHMNELNDVMEAALARDDYATYYERNVAFHDVFLDKSDNAELVRQARIQRERLYDFPRTLGFLKEWDESNLSEHREMVRMLYARNFNAAAEYLRDVHWSFSVQERYIRKYYLALKQE
ncbi:GntR family transcriptional regulator [Synergistaceae bacterium OttesenSCG-928-I11]|nr:GntR family transcriptional regulator [Synergistaceae bacterium OttesenSCG-928-I11]